MKLLISIVMMLQLLVVQYLPIFDPIIDADQTMIVWNIDLLNQSHIASLKEEEFDTLYLYLSNSNKESFVEVNKMSQSEDMAVYALSGSYEWLYVDSNGLERFLKCLLDLEKKHDLDLEGIVLDIEPYVIDASKEELKTYYKVFQESIIRAQEICDKNDWALKIVVPFWYEKVNVEGVDGETNLAEWIMNQTQSVVVMAYRNELYGKNGVFDLIEEEMDYSQLYDTELCVAIETRPSEEGDNISFSEMNQLDVKKVINEIKMYGFLMDRPVRVVVHHFESWLELDEQ